MVGPASHGPLEGLKIEDQYGHIFPSMCEEPGPYSSKEQCATGNMGRDLLVRRPESNSDRMTLRVTQREAGRL